MKNDWISWKIGSRLQKKMKAALRSERSEWATEGVQIGSGEI